MNVTGERIVVENFVNRIYVDKSRQVRLLGNTLVKCDRGMVVSRASGARDQSNTA